MREIECSSSRIIPVSLSLNRCVTRTCVQAGKLFKLNLYRISLKLDSYTFISQSSTMSIQPPPVTPATRKKKSPLDIIRDFPLPEEMAEPLQSVRFGRLDSATGQTHLFARQPQVAEVAFLRQAVSLARQILLHDQTAPFLLEIFHESGQGTPALTLHVIKYLLWTRHWSVVLDRDMHESCFGLHPRPRNMDQEVVVDEAMTLIHLNYRVRLISGDGLEETADPLRMWKSTMRRDGIGRLWAEETERRWPVSPEGSRR